LIKEYAENLVSSRLIGRKGEYFNNLLDNWIFFLVLYHSLINGSFIKASYNVVLETTPMNFLQVVTLKSTGPSYSLNGSLIHA
jgi:hypothetical protein